MARRAQWDSDYESRLVYRRTYVLAVLWQCFLVVKRGQTNPIE